MAASPEKTKDQESHWNKLPVIQLKGACARRELDSTGTKKEMVQRLAEYELEHAPEEAKMEVEEETKAEEELPAILDQAKIKNTYEVIKSMKTVIINPFNEDALKLESVSVWLAASESCVVKITETGTKAAELVFKSVDDGQSACENIKSALSECEVFHPKLIPDSRRQLLMSSESVFGEQPVPNSSRAHWWNKVVVMEGLSTSIDQEATLKEYFPEAENHITFDNDPKFTSFAVLVFPSEVEATNYLKAVGSEPIEIDNGEVKISMYAVYWQENRAEYDTAHKDINKNKAITDEEREAFKSKFDELTSAVKAMIPMEVNSMEAAMQNITEFCKLNHVLNKMVNRWNNDRQVRLKSGDKQDTIPERLDVQLRATLDEDKVKEVFNKLYEQHLQMKSTHIELLASLRMYRKRVTQPDQNQLPEVPFINFGLTQNKKGEREQKKTSQNGAKNAPQTLQKNAAKQVVDKAAQRMRAGTGPNSRTGAASRSQQLKEIREKKKRNKGTRTAPGNFLLLVQNLTPTTTYTQLRNGLKQHCKAGIVSCELRGTKAYMKVADMETAKMLIEKSASEKGMRCNGAVMQIVDGRGQDPALFEGHQQIQGAQGAQGASPTGMKRKSNQGGYDSRQFLIFTAGLPPMIEKNMKMKNELKSMFESYGAVHSMRYFNRTCAHVEMSSRDAQNAIAELNGKVFHGKVMKVAKDQGPNKQADEPSFKRGRHTSLSRDQPPQQQRRWENNAPNRGGGGDERKTKRSAQVIESISSVLANKMAQLEQLQQQTQMLQTNAMLRQQTSMQMPQQGMMAREMSAPPPPPAMLTGNMGDSSSNMGRSGNMGESGNMGNVSSMGRDRNYSSGDVGYRTESGGGGGGGNYKSGASPLNKYNKSPSAYSSVESTRDYRQFMDKPTSSMDYGQNLDMSSGAVNMGGSGMYQQQQQQQYSNGSSQASSNKGYNFNL